MPDNIVNIDFHRHFHIQPGDRVLDLGCGNGRHTTEAARYAGGRIVGLDFSRDDLVAAKFMYDDLVRQGKVKGRADFIVGDAQNLPFKDGAFDKSLCTEVFEHIPDDRRGIAEFIRVTKPGAQTAVSVPAYWPERAYWALSWHYWHSPGGHVRWYRPGQMRQILEESGMQVEFERRRHASQSFYWFLRCIHGLPNENFPPVRLTWKLINVHHNRRFKLLEYLETVANLVIGKDLIHYGRKRGLPAAAASANGAGVTAAMPRER
ncbi:MAG: class I SAM-dependent methyltransferase [Chloroflexota bacterium]|nr:class I SAM-dependent methyltransferase [Chloroflexota bacterium]